VRVRVLGSFEVEGIPARELGSRKGRGLLKILALADHQPVSVDRIADALWGDDQPARPSEQVGVLVSRLRGVLGSDRITKSDAGYALATDWLDVSELRALTAAAARALDEGRVGAARAAADAALRLAGDLLPDEDGEWILAERAAVAATVTQVHRLAVDAAVAAGDHGAAAALAEQALARDPYDEAVLRTLMAAHLAAGRPASALAAYARVRARLAEDLGVPPTSETEAMYGRALAAADGDGPAPPPSLPPPAGIVGRTGELAALDRGLGQVARTGGGLVVVEGDAGIGKTTLVDAWARRVEGQAVVLRGRCDELGRDLPLQPVADALADHLRAVGPERAGVVLGDDAGTLAPLLGPMTASAATVVGDTESARTRIFAALVAVLDRIGDAATPTVLVIEDLHVGSASTLAWMAFARRRSRHTLVVATTRPGGARGLDAGSRISLGALDREAVELLVGAARAEGLYRRSGGHPLLLAALAESPDEAVPATVRDAVAAQVESLGPEVAATLTVAAVLGPDCDLELVSQVARTPVADILDHLESAARAGLITERGGRFEFRHQLIREALEAATGAARRALFHQQAARALAGRPRPDALAVAVHARAGGDATLASTSFAAAAAAAVARFDLQAAEDLLAAALALAPTAEAHTARARVRIARLALDDAAADARAAMALGGGPPALEVAGWAAYYRRDYENARSFAEEAAARATDVTVRASATALAGRILHARGDLAGAVAHLTGVEDAPPPVRGIADAWLAQVRVHEGRPLDALAAAARAMVDADALAHPWAPMHLRFSRAAALGQLGRVAEALRAVAELEEVLAREGEVGARFEAPAANVGAWILRWSGREAEADDRNRRAVAATGGETGPSADAFVEAHYVALLDLADGRLLAGDLGEAAALCRRLQPISSWQGTMAWHQRHRYDLLRARLALADGDAGRAAELAAGVAADAAARGARRYELLARAVLGLAQPSVPAGELDAVVEGLGGCAVLDGWPLVAALAAARASARWRAEAERMAAVVVDGAAGGGEPARRLVARILKP